MRILVILALIGFCQSRPPTREKAKPKEEMKPAGNGTAEDWDKHRI